MKIVVILILRQHDFFSVNGKLRSRDTVSASANRSSEEASVCLVLHHIVIAQNHICQLSIPVLNTELYQNRTVIHNLGICTGFILQMENAHFLSC